MRRTLTVVVCAVVSVVPIAPAEAAEGAVQVDVAQLLSEPAEWNRRRVVLTGELVGDYSSRANGVWVQLNDDSFVGSPIGAGGIPDTVNIGIGARIPNDAFEEIEGPPGRYGRTGPVVRLEGVFMHSDPALQGETYVAVETAATLTAARNHPIPGPDLWLPVGAVLLSLAGGMLYTSRRNPS